VRDLLDGADAIVLTEAITNYLAEHLRPRRPGPCSGPAAVPWAGPAAVPSGLSSLLPNGRWYLWLVTACPGSVIVARARTPIGKLSGALRGRLLAPLS